MKNNILPRVAVLMAAYNGKKYIEKQVESIFNQRSVRVTLIISLDKSDDDTLEIINSLKYRYKFIEIISHNKVFGSAAKNFYFLIKSIKCHNFDFISLSDQDDIWLDMKLISAINKVNHSKSKCYSSNVYSQTENTASKKLIYKSSPQRKWDYLFESASAGCTYLFTQDFTEELQTFLTDKWEDIQNINHHDWLIYAFARSKNRKWFIDNMSYILYIQHRNNVMGANNNLRAFKKRIEMMLDKYWFKQSLLIAETLELNELPFYKNYRLLNRKSFIYLALNYSKCRRSIRDQFAFLLFCIILIFKT